MGKTEENTGLQLSDLKVSNLPELQGWEEKQEKLVSDNPYVEITDNKTYEVACKSRTSLLKGRTELEKQDKLIASKLTAFRKDVKTETDKLIAITLPFEEKQQAEVKRYKGIKKAERQEKERIEKERVDGIKAKIDSIEADCMEIIQIMTFQNVIPDGASIASICKIDFDFEEYEILYHQTLLRIENATNAKIEDLNERENQRVAKEKAEEENRKLKAQQNLQAKRLNDIMPYVAFGEAVDLTNLSDIEESVYAEILSSKKALFESDAKEKREAQEQLDAENLERENKAKEDKEKIFEIRKERLAEIGFVLNEERDGFFWSLEEKEKYAIRMERVFESDAIDFETMITDAKFDIQKLKEKELAKEQEIMSKIAKLLELGLKSPEEKDGYTIADDCDYFLPIKDYYNASEEEFDNILLKAKQAVADYKSSKEDAERLKKENKARVKRLAGSKEYLKHLLTEKFLVFVNEIDIADSNPEIIEFNSVLRTKFQGVADELLTELEKL